MAQRRKRHRIGKAALTLPQRVKALEDRLRRLEMSILGCMSALALDVFAATISPFKPQKHDLAAKHALRGGKDPSL